jgi:biopolymer transport protein ExbB/TolQ
MNLFDIIGKLSYVALAAVALWGAYCIVLILSRVARKRFKDEDAQDLFLESIDPALQAGDFEAVQQQCEGDERALPIMISLACTNRELGYAKVRQLIMDRFQRDVLSDLDVRIAWVITVIKTAPMLGLFGTVLGMMGAFGKLSSATNVSPTELAGDIRLALETTAIGLSIAVPLVLAMATVNNRIKEMQELVASGLTKFLESFKIGLARESGKSRHSA